jgi:hypothetical protein
VCTGVTENWGRQCHSQGQQADGDTEGPGLPEALALGLAVTLGSGVGWALGGTDADGVPAAPGLRVAVGRADTGL